MSVNFVKKLKFWVKWISRQTILTFFISGSITVWCWPPVWLLWIQHPCYVVKITTDLIVWLNPIQSQRRSAVQWYLPLLSKSVFSGLGVSSPASTSVQNYIQKFRSWTRVVIILQNFFYGCKWCYKKPDRFYYVETLNESGCIKRNRHQCWF